MPERMGDNRWRGAKGKNWDNYNSIINTVYFFKSKKHKKDRSILTMLVRVGQGSAGGKGRKEDLYH